jgi:drug/metabolite transporter (DMT)-like permease
MVFFWSINFIVAKQTLREFPPVLCAALRFAFTAIIGVPLQYYLSRNEPKQQWTKRDMLWLAALGIGGICGNQFIWMLGIARTSVAHAAVMIGMSPLAVLLLAAFIGQERITSKKLIGLCIAVAGVGIVQSAKESHTEATVLGDVLIVVSTFLFAFFSVYGKREGKRFGAIMVNAAGNAGATLLLLPATIWYFSTGGANQASLSAWMGLIFMAIFPSLLCYGIFYYALNYLPASKVSALAYLQPVLSTSLAVGLLHEPMSSAFIGGGIVVLAGVLLAERA